MRAVTRPTTTRNVLRNRKKNINSARPNDAVIAKPAAVDSTNDREKVGMHATEWIQEHGRYLRTLSATRLRDSLARQDGECTWCAKQVPKGRRSWCSQECVKDFNFRCGAQISLTIENRDHGICALCGLDTIAIKRRIEKMRSRCRCYGTKSEKHRPHSWARVQRLMRIHQWVGQPYEIDHIVPVVEGGGLCGPENYRTLCIPCHKQETKKLAKRLAAVRRDQDRILIAHKP